MIRCSRCWVVRAFLLLAGLLLISPASDAAGPVVSLPDIHSPWNLIAHRDDGLAYESLAQALDNPRDRYRIRAETFHAIIGLNEGRRERVEQILLKRYGDPKSTPIDKLWFAKYLADSDAGGPVTVEIVGRDFATELSRPSLRRNRSFHARTLSRLVLGVTTDRANALCVPVVQGLSEQIRRTEDVTLLADQIQAMLALKRFARTEQFQVVVSRLCWAATRDKRLDAEAMDLLAQTVAEMNDESGKEAARASLPVLLSSLVEVRDAEETLRHAKRIATLVSRLPDDEVAKLGRKLSPIVTAALIDAVRVTILVNDPEGIARLKVQTERITSRWHREDAERVEDAFHPRHREYLSDVVIRRPVMHPQQVTMTPARGQQLLADIRTLTHVQRTFQYLESRWGSLANQVLRNRVSPREVERAVSERAETLAYGSLSLAPTDAIPLLIEALEHCPMTADQTRPTVPLAESLLTMLERVDPATAAQYRSAANPVLIRFTQAVPVLLRRRQSFVPYLPPSEAMEYLARLERFIQNDDGAYPLRVAASLSALECGNVEHASSVLERYLNHSDRQRRVREISLAFGTVCGNSACGWGVVVAIPQMNRPWVWSLSVSDHVKLLKHPHCVGALQRTVLGSLGNHYRQKFDSRWAFVRFARERYLWLDLWSPPRRAY